MPENAPSMMNDEDSRFDRMLRLVGPESMARLERAHVMLVGCGGVGSWTAETLARAAVGRITLVDFDTVCIRNFNRQLQAVGDAVGRRKVALLAERMRLINPRARIDPLAMFFSADTCARIFAERPDFVIDAIDHVTAKCFLINHCRQNGIPLVVSTGSASRLDPTMIRVADLAKTEGDPLAGAIRKILRGKYGFPRKGIFGIPAVYTLEPPAKPHPVGPEKDCKAGCLCPQGENEFQSCTKKSVILGTAGFVTGAFGMACASVAVRRLISQR